ncbi:dipeptide epimerase [Lysobacter sp. K5869]|uniref:dipeptide epimerase n=1 Tax=Lysobacter sp. K5869 TaxID=2820808 RepID=UPI001C061023|nr:dipeptide epimerase [Lysobacter sp. K5869]QWP76239.1 dipeptide epimerase [Lysobacter sp. K5869]
MPPRPRLRMSLAIEPLPLKAPFAIAGRRFEAMPALVATLTDADGHRGRGEASGVYYLDDEPESMRAALEARRDLIEAGLDRDALRALLPPGGARNAVDCALWELQAQRERRPVWAVAGLRGVRPLLTAFTLGADAPERVAAGALALTQARLIKLKLDGDTELDIARIRAARRARTDVRLIVDANQGYAPERIAPLLAALADHGVELLEQPFPRGHEAALDGFDCPIAVAADESVQGLDELDALAGRYDVVNLKLDKCGGLTEALAMAERARELGLRCMVGNMLGTSWAAAPAFVLGQRCDLVDLDGPTFIAADRAVAVGYRDGFVDCPDEVWGGAAPLADAASETAPSSLTTQAPHP